MDIWVQSWASLPRKIRISWNESREWFTRWLRDWTICHIKERQSELYSLRERQLREDHTKVQKYLVWGGGSSREDGAQLYPVLSSDRTKGNGHKYRKSNLNIKSNILFFFPSCEGGQTLPQLPKKVEGYSKYEWTWPWATCSSWLCSELDGWTRQSPELYSTPNQYERVYCI